jgi:hypothetical protein
MSSVRHPTGRGWIRFGLRAGVLVLCGVLLTGLLTIGIWPGELKLAAPLLCPEGKTDAYVVVDRRYVSPGRTAFDFSLYCLGPRGTFEDVGFGAPFLILSVFHTGLLCAVAMFLLLPATLRRRRAKMKAAL